jgi:hypothetical protein
MSKSLVKVPVHFTGVSPLLQNRDDVLILDSSLKKTKNESYEEHEERVWKNKAHYNVKGEIICPNTWIRKALIASQNQNANPIRPANSRKATDTLRTYFVAGIMVDDAVMTFKGKPITEKDLIPYKKMVSPTGKGKVLCIRPMIQIGWEIKTDIIVLDDMIRAENIYECFAWAGRFNGFGDWRPQRGGIFGIYDVEIPKGIKIG